MTDIIFPPIETENPAQEVVEFDANWDGRIIKCAVTYQALCDHFDAKHSDPLFAFMTGRSDIEQLVSKRLEDSNFEATENLLLHSTDFLPNDK